MLPENIIKDVSKIDLINIWISATYLYETRKESKRWCICVLWYWYCISFNDWICSLFV